MGIKSYGKSKIVILFWNIYLTMFVPFAFSLITVWHLESDSDFTHGRTSALPAGIIIVFVPLVVFGLKWGMDRTFTIVVCCAWFAFIWKMIYYFFVCITYAPVVYYCTLMINITALIWSIAIKVYSPLQKYILQYPQEQWLLPHSENNSLNRILRTIWLAGLVVATIFTFIY